eukprot:m.472457 g.472457  ORF g.472457 m.472457 type:complete len:542 (-) comp20384_c0_seq12:452-2077(-)
MALVAKGGRLADLLLLAAACACTLESAVQATNPRPNFLFIVSDDLRPEVGALGGKAITPNLDKLAHSPGTVVFERAYVQQAICCPTRSSFLTGRRPDTTKVWDLKTYWRNAGGNFTTLPQFFRENGYFTSGMGKVFHPGYHDDAPYSWSEPYFHARDGGLSGNMTLCWDELGKNITDDDLIDGKLAQHAVSVLERVSKMNQPFFVAVGFHRPHLPWSVPQKYFDMYPLDTIELADHNQAPKDYGAARQWSWDPQSGPRHCGPLKQLGKSMPEYALVPDALSKQFRQAYYASVSSLDRNAGVVLDALDRLGLDNSTHVLFIGDHGWQLGDLGEFGKKTNFERATRAPLVVRQAGSRAAAKTSPSLVEFVDIMPTLIDLAGFDVPVTCPEVSRDVALCTEGQSLKPILDAPPAVSTTDQENTTTALKTAVFMQYAHCMHDEGIWHDGCANASEPKVMGYAVRTPRYRFIDWVVFDKTTFPPTAHWNRVLGTELYDHGPNDNVDNVAESVNLAANPDYASTVSTLRKVLHAGWRGARSVRPRDD